MNNQVVTTQWLANNLDKEHLVILDASPVKTVSGKSSQVTGLHIPKSKIFDLKNKFTNQDSQFPNTIPSASQFENECRALGINSNSEIVVYDNLGIYTSPRVWWLFKTMGHHNVKVLDGGLPDWINSGMETVKKTDLNSDYQPGDFKSVLQAENIVLYKDVMDNITSCNFKIIDARSEGRFNGIDPEPRAHLQSGSIPYSANIPYTTLLDNGKFKSQEKLERIFSSQVKNDEKLVFSCGSGLTACIVLLASHIAFDNSMLLYDGSWTEYAELNNLTTTNA